MTTIYFVQHGIAHTKNIDEKRPLSDLGRAETEKVAAHLASHKVPVQRILHTSKLRSRQTAEIFAKRLDVADIAETSGMNPNDAASELIQQIHDDHVMYIGHLPNLQKVVAHLASGKKAHPVVQFQNAGVVCVAIDNDVGTIQWFLTPSLC